MAFGLKSWIGLVAAACVVATLALLPPPQPAQDEFAFAVTGPQRASGRLTPLVLRAYNLSRALTLRDSLLHTLPPAGVPNGGVTLLVSPGLPASTRTSLEARLAPVSRRLAQPGSPTRLVFAVVAETLSSPVKLPEWEERRLQLAYLLPQATDGRTCLVVAALGSTAILGLRRGEPLDSVMPASWRWNWWWGWGDESLRSPLLGPCAYYAAFGPAGRQIEAWLQTSDYLLALEAPWLVEPSPAARGARRIDWTRRAWWRTSQWFQRVPDLEACAGGLERHCAEAVLGAVEPFRWWDRYGFRISGEMSVPGVANLGRLGRASSPRLGPLAPEFLNDLLEDIGPARFAAFWRSDAPVEEAFANAVGTSLGDWTKQWVQGEIGIAPRGPSVPPFSVASAVFVTLALLAGGAALANRRVAG